MTKTLGSFKLHIEEGSFTNNEIIVLLGENGCGKTTLIKMFNGDKAMKPDEDDIEVSLYICNPSRYHYYPLVINLKQSPLNSKELLKNFYLINLERYYIFI